jgi:hypothetical protein
MCMLHGLVARLARRHGKPKTAWEGLYPLVAVISDRRATKWMDARYECQTGLAHYHNGLFRLTTTTRTTKVSQRFQVGEASKSGTWRRTKTKYNCLLFTLLNKLPRAKLILMVVALAVAPRVWFTLGILFTILVIYKTTEHQTQRHPRHLIPSLPRNACIIFLKKTLSRSGTNKDGYTSRTVLIHSRQSPGPTPCLLLFVSAKMTQSVNHSWNTQ